MDTTQYTKEQLRKMAARWQMVLDGTMSRRDSKGRLLPARYRIAHAIVNG